MQREVLKKLENWAIRSGRKPLILKGARQVGKTFAVTEFGRTHFQKCHVFNFEENKDVYAIFEKNLDPRKIIDELSYVRQTPINIQKDLVFFDEIQECPRALTSLKYFCEDMPVLALIAAGSLLGIKLSDDSFPVGKVEFLYLYPMNFREFLVVNDSPMLVDAYDHASMDNPIPEMAHQQLWRELLNYYVTGGMPQAVSTYLANKSDKMTAFTEVRTVQKFLVDSYSRDFAKHSGKTNSIHIVSVFENVPMQLSAQVDASTKRYHFNHVIPGKRGFAQLQGPVDWLENAGLVIKVHVCNRAEIPLKAFCKNNLFKLFIFDIGLLGAMLSLPVKSILEQDFGITKGYLAESFVAQEFLACSHDELYSWAERNSEIEFLTVMDGAVVPVEVKAGHRTQAKSLQQFLIKYSTQTAIKLSANPFSKTDRIVNLPLYLAGKVSEFK